MSEKDTVTGCPKHYYDVMAFCCGSPEPSLHLRTYKYLCTIFLTGHRDIDDEQPVVLHQGHPYKRRGAGTSEAAAVQPPFLLA